MQQACIFLCWQLMQSSTNNHAYVDSHLHYFGTCLKLFGLSLFDCNSAQEVIEKCRNGKYLSRAGWIYGIGWKYYPDNQLSLKQFDLYFPDIPVYLINANGHEVFCNSAAFKIAGIIPPASGLIDEPEKSAVYSKIPKYGSNQLMEMFLLLQSLLIESGFSSVCDMQTEIASLETFLKLDAENKLKIGINCYFEEKYLPEAIALYKDSKHVKICGIKLFADGTLGSQSAAISMNYENTSGNGNLLLSEKQIYASIIHAAELNLDIAVHAIGDIAVKAVLNAAGEARKTGVKNIIRCEHCIIIDPADITKFSRFNVIASIQPAQITSDVPLIRNFLPEPLQQHAYLWNSLLDSGAEIVAGSDSPVDEFLPKKGIEALTYKIPGFIEHDCELVSHDQAEYFYTKNAYNFLELK